MKYRLNEFPVAMSLFTNNNIPVKVVNQPSNSENNDSNFIAAPISAKPRHGPHRVDGCKHLLQRGNFGHATIQGLLQNDGAINNGRQKDNETSDQHRTVTFRDKLSRYVTLETIRWKYCGYGPTHDHPTRTQRCCPNIGANGC